MPYPINESFANGIPAGFAAVRGNSVVTHNAALGCVVIDTPDGSASEWRILEVGATRGFDFEVDLELEADTFGQKHFGFFLTTNEAASGFSRGWRFSSYVPYNLDTRDYANAGQQTERARVTSPAVPTTGIVTWRVQARNYRYTDGYLWHFKVTIGGIVFFYDATYINTYGEMPALMPAIFTYGCKLRVHAIRAVALPEIELGFSGLGLFASRRGFLPANAQIGFSSLPLKNASKNVLQGGSGRVAGVVTIENIPGARQVRLFNKRSGLLVSEVWSTPTGQYEFNNVDAQQEYFVVAHDHLRVYNAVVQDMLAP